MIIKRHQTFFDFVTQHAGSMEVVFVSASLNGIGITDDVEPGSELAISASNLFVVNSYIRGGLEVSTNFDLDNVVWPGGIGYMQIGNDFKVS